MIALSRIKPCKVALATPIISLRRRHLHLKPITFDLERTSLHPARSEICLSGDEADVAHHKSSFDPSITNPEREFQTLDEECTAEGIVDPLLFSPVNLEISRILRDIANHEVYLGEGRKFGSGKGWTRKGKLVNVENIPGDPFERYEKLLEVLKKRAEDYSAKHGEHK